MLVWLVASVAVGTGSDYVDNISCLPVSVVWPPEKGGPQSHSFSRYNGKRLWLTTVVEVCGMCHTNAIGRMGTKMFDSKN
jgi:hypothetical protein